VKVGCGAHILLVSTEQTDEQGLRKASRDERGVCLGGYESLDGEALGSLVSYNTTLQHYRLPSVTKREWKLMLRKYRAFEMPDGFLSFSSLGDSPTPVHEGFR
jgi:hypothetical protein